MENNIFLIKPPDPNYRRYSQKIFPAYRYVLGLNPHPTENPQGHSFGKENEEIEVFNPNQWQTNQHYLYGIDLYNFAYWWEAHEAWEGLWGIVPKNDIRSHFLQGLIQISAAFLKWHLQEAKGVKMLYESAMKYFSFVYPTERYYMGIDLKIHLDRLSDHFKVVRTGSFGRWPDPLENYPFIELKGEL